MIQSESTHHLKLLDELHVALEPEDPEFLKKFSKDSIVLPYFKWMPQAVRRILSKLDLVDLSIACTLRLLIKGRIGSLFHW